jgi:membrane protein implicated in regulation of membrane protease activity
MEAENDNRWHLSRSVPIAMIGAFVMQSVVFVWVGASWKQAVDNRLDQLERADNERKGQEARLIRLEERLMAVTDLLEKIDARLAERRP